MLESCKVEETYYFTHFEVDGHIIALSKIRSYSGGTSNHLFKLIVDGKTRCSRTTYSHGMKKALEILNNSLEILNNSLEDTPKIVTVELRAFTGMCIGEYKAVKSSKGFTLTVKNGKTLEFNLEGIQTNTYNSRFANTVIVK